MKSKELVKICKKHKSCKECQYKTLCIAYQFQFYCYPFDVKPYYEYPPEAYSDIEIQVPDYLI